MTKTTTLTFLFFKLCFSGLDFNIIYEINQRISDYDCDKKVT